MAKTDIGWSGTELLQTVSEYVGSGYNQDAPDFAQFCHAVAKIIRKRRLTSPSTLCAAPCIFVMAPVPTVVETAEQHPMFDRAREELAGKVWFGAKRLAAASALTLPQGTDADLFEHVVEVLGVGDAPTIFFDASHDDCTMRLYAQGMQFPDKCDLLSLDAANLTLDYIHDVLSVLHEELLETPSASESQGELWIDRAKWYPINESEKGIQKILYIALKSHLLFSSLKIEQEHSSRMGRCDFILKEQDPIDSSHWTHHVILELKVVKSFTHTGTPVTDGANQQAISYGLDQARDYRVAHSCRLAALCCYDMRKKPNAATAIEHECNRAIAEAIGLWAWPIYNKAKAARTHNRSLSANQESSS